MAKVYKGYSIKVKPNGNSLITVSCGRDETGKQLFERTTFKPDKYATDKQNQKALTIFALEFEQKVRSNRYFKGEKLLLRDFAEDWLKEYASTNLERLTYRRHEDIVRKHIIPALGHLTLIHISPYQLNSFYKSLLEDGCRHDGKPGGYATGTIRRIHATLSSILSIAVQWQIIDSNPCSKVRLPKQSKDSEEIKFFNLEQTQQFLKILDMELPGKDKKYYQIPLQMKVFFYISLFAGTRRGETLALTWDNVDFINKTIEIKKSASTVEGVNIKKPKTLTSNRVISLPESIMDLLRLHKKEQAIYKLSVGNYWDSNSNFLFTQEDGSLLCQSSPYLSMKRVIKRYNDTIIDESKKIPCITLHGLRHTSATLLISQNLDIRTVSSRLGHSKVSTTLDIYTHSLKKKDEEAGQALDSMLRVSV